VSRTERGPRPQYLARAVLAFLALPGTVAFVVPVSLVDHSRRFDPLSLLLLVPGVAGLVACVVSFYVEGRGTLAPWSPPRTLVTSGLYRYSRNPMYVGVLLILCGWAIGLWSWVLAIYAAGIAIAVHVRVLVNEEPFLARTHGAAWTAYRARVGRWLSW